MASTEKSLKGWKTIAAYLGVTSSTAIRWSKQPGFPVQRASDGATVYARPSDLDAWLRRRLEDDEPQAAQTISPPAVKLRRRALLIGTVLTVVVTGGVGGGLLLLRPRETERPKEIRDTELQELYLDARSDWAARTPESLRSAIVKFRTIVARYPDFSLGFSGLADAYILSCEFGDVSRNQAFRDARAATTTALALEPDDADANRIMGFLVYWTDRDIAAARPYFRRSLGADQRGYLSHLWYGNALVDAGEIADGTEQLTQAVRLAPDSPAVITDYSIALWQTGESHEALRRLADVERRFPTHSGAPGAAALFRLQAGDVEGYLEDSARWATLIGDPNQIARVRREHLAFEQGGSAATLHMMAASEAMPSSFWHGGNLPASIAASMIGDRGALLKRLRIVEASGENWRDLRFPGASFARWRTDPEIGPLLERILG
ncbi:invasion protein regulator [Brevundimonas sp. SH203]|uniref:tetratricopeptide repeat protein n=1 Tax=Brevundimonas sp. SH203 TaxID=345167 RepID=UPI0009C8845E|nr:tetratricopeptide repeat protein [Brevundimonas sp. SH203]GAW41177.1 invasion protein regulator [Brevundimonas sp. SH203]